MGNREQFEDMMAFVAEHRIRPVVGATYALDEAGQALRDIADGGHFGKLVVNLKELP